MNIEKIREILSEKTISKLNREKISIILSFKCENVSILYL